MHKLFHSLSLLLGTFLLLGSSAIAAGSVVTGKSIIFDNADLLQGTAQKGWAINNPATDLDTEVFDIYHVIPATDKRRLALSPPITAEEGYVTWRIEVPDSYAITSFTFGVRVLWLGGNGDDRFQFQYSFDNHQWTPFYRKVNNKGDQSKGLRFDNLVLTQDAKEIAAAASHVLYIRAVHIEGTSIANDSGYFAIASNDKADGGTNPNSYIKVSIQPASDL